jgi:hypothetical protein
MNFGLALELLKEKPMQAKLARYGWNGQGQWVCLMGPLILPPFNTQGTDRKVNDRAAGLIGPNTPLDSQPYFAFWTVHGKWQPGWVPSTADILADDWFVVA